MELWRQCAMWLIDCRVLPENHRVTWEGAQVCDLAQALRDGVLLCQLLNNLLHQAVNLKEINLRPQMSQFLCLKNIRTFLAVCQEKFHLKKSELFEAFDLFDVRDFAKVTLHLPTCLTLLTLSLMQCSALILQSLCSMNSKCNLFCMFTQQQKIDKRECCLQEIKQTEEKYSDTLQSILQVFTHAQSEYSCFYTHTVKHTQACKQTVMCTFNERVTSMPSLFCKDVRSSIKTFGAKNLYVVFLNYKERLLLYGSYCSQVEAATKHLDKLSNMREDIRMKLEECSKRANSGRFSLRDLLMVPMQRVLKYHLLLQELVKHTTDPAEKENLRTALDAMRDLAQCVNEVKRDNEILKQITSFQLSIENMTQSLALYGRPKIDGELKISSTEKKSKQDRYAFLFDKAMFVCKKKSGETFELKEIIELQNYQIRDEPTGEKDKKKWSYFFLLLNCYGRSGYDLFFKTRELKKKWLEQFEMALSNMCPENATANSHDFQMFCFEETTSCKACSMLLRWGTFFQGYLCSRCKMAAHKECLDLLPHMSSFTSSPSHSGFPKMEVCQEYYGLPPPPVGFGQPLHLSRGDIIELTRADADLAWWEGRNLTVGQMGWFPCQKVQPYVSVRNMDRTAAKNLLMSRSDGTFLVRQKDGGEFAISIKFNMDIRHIKITATEGLYRINDKKAFKGLIEMIQFYQHNSLKEYFKDVDTTLRIPYKQPEQSNSSNNTTCAKTEVIIFSGLCPKGGSMRCFGVARARYDFSARDRSELSLREGDTIKILSKKGHSGWWKGEVYGRVGLFPANYVEEDYSDYC
uniref:Osteoclast-stimulating factor 1 n=1 Tax=Mastacembelus armatus TaxID=205130 RepID=A0A7N8Y4P1_9TELE